MQLPLSHRAHTIRTIEKDAENIYRLLSWVKKRIGVLFLDAASKKGISKLKRATKKTLPELIGNSCAEVWAIINRNKEAKTYDALIIRFLRTTLIAEWSDAEGLSEQEILQYSWHFPASNEASLTNRTTIASLLTAMGMEKDALDKYLLLARKSNSNLWTEDIHK
jgi:hypothetical protein